MCKDHFVKIIFIGLVTKIMTSYDSFFKVIIVVTTSCKRSQILLLVLKKKKKNHFNNIVLKNHLTPNYSY